MPFIPQAALDRIRELEQQLAAERVMYETWRAAVEARHQSRVTALERRVDWQSDMLLRRGESFPLPVLKEGKQEETKATARPLPSVVIAKYEAIRTAAAQSGKTLTDPDVVQWVKDETGHTPSEIEQRMQEKLSSELTQ
jgi:hypothetical protein